MGKNISVIRWRFKNSKAYRATFCESHRIYLWTRKVFF